MGNDVRTLELERRVKELEWAVDSRDRTIRYLKDDAKRIRDGRIVFCIECDGEGEYDTTCGSCAGSGVGPSGPPDAPGNTCRVCGGSGGGVMRCEDCDGSGEVEAE